MLSVGKFCQNYVINNFEASNLDGFGEWVNRYTISPLIAANRKQVIRIYNEYYNETMISIYSEVVHLTFLENLLWKSSFKPVFNAPKTIKNSYE
jgi:hypothetical protein